MKHWRKTEWVLAVICLAASTRLFYAAWIDSMDFDVYWQAAQNWIAGKSPYLYDGTERGFIFKYPPWTLPFFAPFGFLGRHLSRMVWALAEFGCLIYAISWVHQNNVPLKRALLAAFFFWWIWLGHFFAGQLTLILLATALWAVPPPGRKPRPESAAVVTYVFSSKIFSLVSLVGLGKRLTQPKTVIQILGLVLFGTLFSWVVSLLAGFPTSVGDFLKSWTQAASSGGVELGARFVRGQMNHSFTAGILRWLSVSSSQVGADVAVCLTLSAVFGALWYRFSKNLTVQERWSGWLALGVIVHPLAWHHSYVLAYPLCALAWDRALKSKNSKWIAMGLSSFVMIGILIPNIFGPALGASIITPLELVSIKSWGVCLAAYTLLKSRLAKS